MSDEAQANPAETTGEQGEVEEVQTATMEQFEELKRQLEETRKAQSGSDRTVAELRKALEQKEQEAENAKKSATEKAEQRIAEIEKKLQLAEAEKFRATQLSIAQKLLADEGVQSPSFINRFIGDNDEETEATVKEYIENVKATKLSAADEFARKNGRKVTNTDKSESVGTFDDYTDEQIKAMSAAEFERVYQRTYSTKE